KKKLNMKSFLAYFFLFIAHFSFAQEISETLIIDGEVNFCKPGVLNKSPGKGMLLDYRIQPNYTFKNDDISTAKIENNIRFNSKLKIPIIIKPGFKLLIGFRYMIEEFNFDASDVGHSSLYASIDGRDLKTTAAAIYISKPLNDRLYTSFRFGVSYSGNYSGFSTGQDRYATYRGVGVFGIKKSENFEYGFGLMYSKSFRNLNVLPFGFLNRTYNDKWGIEFAIPLSFKVRRNFRNGSMLLFGPQFASRSYSLDVQNMEEEKIDIFHLRRAGVETTLTFKQRIKGWLWMEANAGYAINLKVDVDNTETNVETKLNQSNGVYGSIGIFLSPPMKNKVCENTHQH
ncbi:MAG: hypothetical protein ACI9LN_001532, partial [Saprospiraceae bacterium]